MKNIVVPLIFKCLACLPLSAARIFGAFLGYCVWLTKGRSYRITLLNVKKCFPELNDLQIRCFVRESLIETMKTIVEAGAIWSHSAAWLHSKIVAIEGEDILRAELAKGKGLLVLSPHIGNWEVVGPYIANISPLTVLYQPLELPALNQLIFVGRSKLNISLAPTNRKGVCMLLKALQQGTTIGILPDQVPDKGSGAEPVNFFGHPAMTMSLVHSLIERTHCRVVSVFAKRVKGGFNIIILPAATEIYSENLNESLRGLNLCVEACVRLAPTQYQWEYSRFRSLPLHLRDPDT